MKKSIIFGLDGACPQIISEKVAAGRLPNFKRLFEMGVKGENLPYPSSVTPGNWTSIATSTKPRTNGISDFEMHKIGEALDQQYDVFSKTNNHLAEFAWDALSQRGKKVATFSFPASIPSTSDNHLVIGCQGAPKENTEPWTVAKDLSYISESVVPNDIYHWHEYETMKLEPCQDVFDSFQSQYSFICQTKKANPGYSGQYEITMHFGLKNGIACMRVSCNESVFFVEPHQWTPYMELEFARNDAVVQEIAGKLDAHQTIVAEMRIRLIECDLDAQKFMVYIPSIYPKYAFSSDEKVTNALRDELGPYNDNLPISRILTQLIDEEGFVDEFRKQALWQAKASVKLVNDLDYAMAVTKWHGFDKYYHFFMHKIDRSSPRFNEAEFDYFEQLHDDILDIADEAVGVVLDGLQEDTTLVVISDHGLMASSRCAWVNRYLRKNGYIVTKVKDGKEVVDWSKTKAYVSAFMILNVNLIGRDPEGIVAPGAEYEQLKKDLIKLLRGWYDETTQDYVLSDVFDPSVDGLLYGMGSPLDGDVRYYTSPGTTLFRSQGCLGDELVTDVEGPYLGDHGSCRPSTRLGRGSEVGIFYACGNGVKKGYQQAYPIRPDDVIPTLFHIMGEDNLRNQEGSIAYDILL